MDEIQIKGHAFLPEGRKGTVIDSPTWVTWDKEWAVVQLKGGARQKIIIDVDYIPSSPL